MGARGRISKSDVQIASHTHGSDRLNQNVKEMEPTRTTEVKDSMCMAGSEWLQYLYFEC